MLQIESIRKLSFNIIFIWTEGKTQQQCEMKKVIHPKFPVEVYLLPCLLSKLLTYLLAFTDHNGYAFPQEAVATTKK